MTVGDASLGKSRHALLTKERVSEAVVRSTCIRTKVYAVAEKFHGGYADVREVLADLAFLDPEDFADHLYVHHDSAAAAPLFDVASGLASAVRGEHALQCQVKPAWRRPRRDAAAATTMTLLLRHAPQYVKPKSGS